jgi:hypothetical protein
MQFGSYPNRSASVLLRVQIQYGEQRRGGQAIDEIDGPTKAKLGTGFSAFLGALTESLKKA